MRNNQTVKRDAGQKLLEEGFLELLRKKWQNNLLQMSSEKKKHKEPQLWLVSAVQVSFSG